MIVSGTFALQYAKKISEKGGLYVIENSSVFRYERREGGREGRKEKT